MDIEFDPDTQCETSGCRRCGVGYSDAGEWLCSGCLDDADAGSGYARLDDFEDPQELDFLYDEWMEEGRDEHLEEER